MESHTIIEVRDLDDTQTNKSSLLDLVEDDCNNILEETDERIVGRYEQYGQYPNKEIINQTQENQIIILSTIKIPNIYTILFINGERVDTYQDNYTELKISSYMQTEYNVQPYVEEYIEKQRDKIECELSVPIENPIEDVSGGNLHVTKVSPSRIEVTIEAEDGRTLSQSKMTKEEAFQLIRELEEEMNVYEYSSK